MKFRIKETKIEYSKSYFIPQYKTFLFWHDIADTNWASTIFCNLDFNDRGKLHTMIDAKQCISDYKSHLKKNNKYQIIYNIK